MHRTVGAVRQQVNRIQGFTTLEVIGHLLQAVLGRVKHHDFGVASQTGQQLLDITDLTIDEHHLLTLGSSTVLGVLGETSIVAGAVLLRSLLFGGAVDGRLCGGLRCILSNCPNRCIEHDPWLQGDQQWRCDRVG